MRPASPDERDAAIAWYAEIDEEMLVGNFIFGFQQYDEFARAGEEYPWGADLMIVANEMVKRGLLTLH